MKKPKKSPDTNSLRKSRGIIGALLVIGLILLIPLFFVIPIRANAPVAKPVSTYTPQWTPTPLFTLQPGVNVWRLPPTPYALGIKPPSCTFPLAQTTTTESPPENYIFSEPKEPIPANDESSDIVEWLPDNQRVLLVEQFQGSGQQDIELFNPQTGEIQIYATREAAAGSQPTWVPGLNAIIYAETKFIKATIVNGMRVPPYEYERQLWVSRGDPNGTQLLDDAHLTGDLMYGFTFAVQPGGKEIIYRAAGDKQLFKKDAALIAEPSVAFDPSHWDYRASSSPLPLNFTMAWRPGTSQVFLYDWGNALRMGYTFLLDANTGKICELNLGGWPFFGRWSSDGRYLAIIRNRQFGWPARSTDLTVLDTATGLLYTSGIVPEAEAENNHVSGVAWAPDNHHLLVLDLANLATCAPDCSTAARLYLVDFLSGQVEPLLPSVQFAVNDPGTNLAWSPDGSKVIALCPNLCVISVQRTSQ